MIEKYIEYFYGDSQNSVLELLHPGSLEKTAQIGDEISKFISDLPEDKDHTYVLCNALSAGEYYGSNRNGDYFPEEALKQYHKTFEALGYVYRLHQNKDPQKAIGKVIFSYYNPNMHRVELVLKLNNKLAKDEIEKLKKNDKPATSMGAKVPFDVCSICGNKAKTRAEYCKHLKEQLNQVLPSGQKVYAINTMPKFFDLSIVMIPAEKTSSLLKIMGGSSKNSEKELNKVACLNNFEKVAELTALAEIDKKIEGDKENVLVAKNPKELARIVDLTRNKINPKTIEKLAEYPLNEVLSTFLVLRIMPTPEDFQKLALYSFNQKDLADSLEKDKIVFKETNETKEIEDITIEGYNEKVASLIEDEIINLSLTKDLVITRGLIKVAQQMLPNGQPAEAVTTINQVFPHSENNSYSEYPTQSSEQPSMLRKIFLGSQAEPKKSAVMNPIIPLGILGLIYGSYAGMFNKFSKSRLLKFVNDNPLIIPAAVLGGAYGSTYIQEREFNKTAGFVSNTLRNAFLTIPTSYYYAGKSENKARTGEEINNVEDFVRKHPLLTGIATAALGAKLEKEIRKMASFVSRIPDDKKDIILKDLIEGEEII